MTPSQTAHPTEGEVKLIVDRFLSWKLPETFSPDCGISFKPLEPRPPHSWPIGTNLLCATEAEAMLRHVLDIQPPAVAPQGEQETWHERLIRLVKAKDYAAALALLRAPAPNPLHTLGADLDRAYETPLPDIQTLVVRPQGEEGLARKHAVELEQCSLFVDSPPLAKAMTDAAEFLRALSNQGKPSS